MNLKSNYLYPFAFGAGIMLSPEALAMAGNFFGYTGFPGILFIGAAALVLVLADDCRQTVRNKNPRLSATLSLVPKLTTALFLSTGILVSSGFVFNEVFVYWFPNFGFAFLLLALLVLCQFFPSQIIHRLQLGFTAVAASGLLVLTLAGMTRFVGADAPQIPPTSPGFQLAAVFMPLLLFIGFDMARDAPPHETPRHIPPSIWIMALIFILWGIIALLLVPREKLAQSTISYMRIARTAMGDPGRMVMGAVVIAGSLAAVQALFFSIRNDISTIFPCPGQPGRPWIAIILGIAIGACMAGGLAGEDILEPLISGSLVLWLISYLAIMAMGIRQKSTSHAPTFKHLAGTIALAAGIILFITTLLTKEIP